jgi:hypothetical protein
MMMMMMMMVVMVVVMMMMMMMMMPSDGVVRWGMGQVKAFLPSFIPRFPPH